MSLYLDGGEYNFSDHFRWLRKLDEFELDINGVNNDLDLDKFQKEIISLKDYALAFFFASSFGFKNYLMQKVILESHNPKYSFLFAFRIKDCDVKAFQNIVIRSNKIKYICKFACFVEGADLDKLSKLLLKTKSAKYSHMWIKHLGIYIDKFKQIIINSNKPRYLYELAKHLTDIKDIRKIEKLIIKSKSFTYIRLFAAKIKQADIAKLEKAILDSGNIKEIKKFAKQVKKSEIKNFLVT